MVKTPKANLQPRATMSSFHVRESGEQHGRYVSVSKQEQKGVAGVVLLVIRGGVIAACPHCGARNGTDTTWRCKCSRKDGTDTVGCQVDWMRNGAGFGEMWAGCHLTAAGSCCLEMALWSTLCLDTTPNSNLMEDADNPPLAIRDTWSAFAASSLQDERDKADVWISVKFGLFSSLSHVTWTGAGCSNEGRVAGKGGHNGNIQVRDGTVEVENKVHARMLPLSVHDTSEGWYRLFDEHLGTIV